MPAYSFGHRYPSKFASNKSAIPGPNAYSLTNIERERFPAWTIGRSERGKLNDNEIPAPNQYESKEDTIHKRWPKYAFGEKLGKEGLGGKKEVPGPGTYSAIVLANNNPSFSMTSKPRPFPGNDFPGPLDYKAEVSSVNNRPSSKIGNARREDLYLNTETPGPGTYSVRREFGDEKLKGKFTRANRKNLSNVDGATPGPGSYNISRESHTFSRNFTFKSATSRNNKVQKDLRDIFPGPGEYDPLRMKYDTSCRLGRAARGKVYTEDTPGPGNYSINDLIYRMKPKWKIGLEVRSFLKNSGEHKPGPGTYQPTTASSGPKYGFGLKAYDKEHEMAPGPLDYDSTLILTKSHHPTFRIGSARRDFRSTEEIPGPGQYNIKPRPSTAHKFGKSQRIDFSKSSGPGPGTYEYIARVSDVPKYLIPSPKRSERFL